MPVSSSLVVHSLVNVVMLYMVYIDWNRGLGAANGWWVSFLHSAHSAYHYRLQQVPQLSPLGDNKFIKKMRGMNPYWVMHPKSSGLKSMRVVCACAFLKFGGGVIVSMFLHLKPVIFKSPRHFFSFAFALALVQAAPFDFFFKTLQKDSEHGLLSRLVLNSACALYKVRKLTFIVVSGYSGGPSFVIFLAFVAVEFSTVFRRIENYVFNVPWDSQTFKLWRNALAEGFARYYSTPGPWLTLLSSIILVYSTAYEEVEGAQLYPLDYYRKIAALFLLCLRYNLLEAQELGVVVDVIKGEAAAVAASVLTPQPVSRTIRKKKKNATIRSRSKPRSLRRRSLRLAQSADNKRQMKT